MPDYYIAPESSFDATADAIRAKTGSQESIEWTEDGFADAIADIPSGISPDEFYGLGNNSYEIKFEALTELRNRSPFYYNGKITKLVSNTITWVETNGFRGCSNLEEISLPECTKIGLANATSIDSYAFAACPKLVSFNLPKLQNIHGLYNFQDCGTSSNKALIVLPSIVELGWQTFKRAYFSDVDLGQNLTQIRGNTFSNAGSFDNVILRSLSVVEALESTSIAGIKNIYVPSALTTSYSSATNWSVAISGGTITVHSIEGSYYETHYADGTAIPTT